MRFSIYQESRTGARRINQDRMGYLYTRDALLMLLADGMGGHTRGEIGAQLALQTMAARFERQATDRLSDPAGFLREAALAAHYELHRYRAENRLPEAPRTTLVACVVQRGLAVWAHVGDSRLYLIRGSRIVRQTVDHSRVQQLIAAGALTPEDAKRHPERNRILNCVGASAPPTIEVGGPVALHHGDTLLLCSDGLWSSLVDRELVQGFAGTTLMRAVPELIELALRRAGDDADNCTALAMTWAGVDAAEMVPPTDEAVSTLAMPAGAVASTVRIPSDHDPVEVDPLTEEQIEDAVREIQRAIRRSIKLVDGGR